MNKKYAIFILEGLVLLILCTLNRNIIIAYIWILLHEASHIIVALLFSVKLSKFKIHVTGVSCSFNQFDNLSENRKIILYISGPLFNLVSAIILLIISKYFYQSDFISRMVFINLSLFIFNMLPAYPLDGCRIYESLLLKILSYKKSRKILEIVSLIISGSFVLLFIISVYIHKINFTILITSILIIFTTISESKKTSYILLNDILNKKITIQKRQFIENKSVSVYYECTLGKTLTLLDKNKLNYICVLDENLNLKKVLSEVELINAVKRYGNITFNEYLIYNGKETI